MVGRDHDQSVLRDAQSLELGQQLGDAHVHVSDLAVVLGDDPVLIGDAGWHPRLEVLGEGLEIPHGLHRVIARGALVALVEHAVEGLGREVR